MLDDMEPPFEVPFKKKRNHDVAYLIIMLTILFAVFFFAITIVNNLFRSIGV